MAIRVRWCFVNMDAAQEYTLMPICVRGGRRCAPVPTLPLLPSSAGVHHQPKEPGSIHPRGGSVRKALWLCLLVGLPGWAQNDPDEMVLGATLKLGMPQEQVLAEVGKHYTVKPLSDPTQFVVFTRPKDATEKPRWEGMLTFKTHKLVSVERL